jgi:topoisomerase-4 subunit A
VAVTNQGYLLCFPVADLPQLPKGKGNKIIGIPPKAQDERLAALLCLAPSSSLVIHSGKRHLTLKPDDLEGYNGLRGRRGKLLPRGLQRVEKLAVAE